MNDTISLDVEDEEFEDWHDTVNYEAETTQM